MAVEFSTKMPSMFLFHGLAGSLLDGKNTIFEPFDKNSPSCNFMRSLHSTLETKYNIPSIKSILIFSAHWKETQVTIDSTSGSAKLYFDYYGFPPEAYPPHMTYPITTDSRLAERIHNLLDEAGVPNTLQSRKEGFDHGSFIPLKLAFPESNIPVVQVSLNKNLDIADHIQLGEALAPLRSEGVLIICGGAMLHNLRAIESGYRVDPRGLAFVSRINELLTGLDAHNYEERKQRLIDVPSTAPYFAAMHPRTEHFIPLAVAFGTAIPTTVHGETVPLSVRREYHEIAMGTVCADSYVFN